MILTGIQVVPVLGRKESKERLFFTKTGRGEPCGMEHKNKKF